MLHGLPTGMEPDVIRLQQKGCLLQPDFGNLSLQLSQCSDVAVRINGLYRSQKNHMDHLLSQKMLHITLLTEGCVLKIFFNGAAAFSTPACSGDVVSPLMM